MPLPARAPASCTAHRRLPTSQLLAARCGLPTLTQHRRLPTLAASRRLPTSAAARRHLLRHRRWSHAACPSLLLSGLGSPSLSGCLRGVRVFPSWGWGDEVGGLGGQWGLVAQCTCGFLVAFIGQFSLSIKRQSKLSTEFSKTQELNPQPKTEQTDNSVWCGLVCGFDRKVLSLIFSFLFAEQVHISSLEQTYQSNEDITLHQLYVIHNLQQATYFNQLKQLVASTKLSHHKHFIKRLKVALNCTQLANCMQQLNCGHKHSNR